MGGNPETWFCHTSPARVAQEPSHKVGVQSVWGQSGPQGKGDPAEGCVDPSPKQGDLGDSLLLNPTPAPSPAWRQARGPPFLHVTCVL